MSSVKKSEPGASVLERSAAAPEAKSRKERRALKFAALASWVATFAAAITLGATVSIVISQIFDTVLLTRPQRTARADLDDLRADFRAESERILARLDTLESRVDAMSNNTDNSEVSVQIAALRAELDGAIKRMETLENALLENPTRALSLPLLRKDLHNLEEDHQRDLDASAKAIDRIYDQNKWFIGLMFTMAVGLIGLAVSNFMQVRRGEGN